MCLQQRVVIERLVIVLNVSLFVNYYSDAKDGPGAIEQPCSRPPIILSSLYSSVMKSEVSMFYSVEPVVSRSVKVNDMLSKLTKK